MALTRDIDQARRIGTLLYNTYQDRGVLDAPPPPERPQPDGLTRGSEDHLHWLTLTMALSHHRSAAELWDAARATYEDPDTRYLFAPHAVAQLRPEKLSHDLARHDLARNPEKDAATWRRICTTLVADFDGSMATLLERAGYDAPAIVATIRSSKHDIPYLGGAKTGSLWLHLLEDAWYGHPIDGLQEMPIYTNRDVVAGTIAAGVIRGPFSGPYRELEQAVAEVWTAACAGTDHYPMQFYRALAALGHDGCRQVAEFPCERRTDCPIMIFCVEARPRGRDEVEIVAPSRIGSPISL